ncbi:MAG: hypothetical protein K2M42_12265, partial [Oscillospiraceae bacterium]|nr:hypothetical protein [Oscillospiraceae bacterium]
MAIVKLGSKEVGSTVKLNVGGVATEFLVVHQGLPGAMYDASCDGTWLLMKDCYEERPWRDFVNNTYENCDLDAYLNSTFRGLFDADIQAVVKLAKIPYRKNGGQYGTTQNGVNGLARNIFLLSAPEVNFVHRMIDPGEGAALDYFKNCHTTSVASKRIAYLNGSATIWHLRSPNIESGFSAFGVSDNGSLSYGGSPDYPSGVRPAMILPADLWVTDDGTITTDTAPT